MMITIYEVLNSANSLRKIPEGLEKIYKNFWTRKPPTQKAKHATHFLNELLDSEVVLFGVH